MDSGSVPIPIRQIATFTGDSFHGNPVWVVTLEFPRPARLLQALCRHLSEPMIAVLVLDGKKIHLRFFTPLGLHSGAGHATHAAACVAFDQLSPDLTSIEFRLDNDGRRRAHREGDFVSVDWPIMPYTYIDRTAVLGECLGLRPGETFLSPFGLIALFASEDEVAGVEPDLERLAQLAEDVVIVTAPAGIADFVLRVFAPKVGLPEDPVCGTAHRVLVPLWSERSGRRKLVSHQLSLCGGELFCRLDGDTVTISGRATPIIGGILEVPGLKLLCQAAAQCESVHGDKGE